MRDSYILLDSKTNIIQSFYWIFLLYSDNMLNFASEIIKPCDSIISWVEAEMFRPFIIQDRLIVCHIH